MGKGKREKKREGNGKLCHASSCTGNGLARGKGSDQGMRQAGPEGEREEASHQPGIGRSQAQARKSMVRGERREGMWEGRVVESSTSVASTADDGEGRG